MHRKLTARTARAAKDILTSALEETKAEVLYRHPGDSMAQLDALQLPLRTTVHYAHDDHAHYKKMTANTLGGTQDILRAARNLIEAESQRLHPGDRPAQLDSLDRLMSVTVHYDLADLDRQDPLNVDECLHLPDDGLPPGLRPYNCHPGYDRLRRTPMPQPQKRSLIKRVFGI